MVQLTPPPAIWARIKSWKAWTKLHRGLAQNAAAIRTIEFGLAFSCVIGSWFGSGDMALVIPALCLGLVFVVAGLVGAPRLSTHAKVSWASGIAIIFILIGSFLNWHFQASATKAAEKVPAASLDTEKAAKIAAAKRWVRLADEIASELPELEAGLSSPIIGHDLPHELQERLWIQNSERLSRTLGASMGRMNQKYQGRLGEAALEMRQFGINMTLRHGGLSLPPVNTIGWNDWAIELSAQGRHMLTTYGVQD